jgi:formate hydrogenlyase subunit 4
MTLTVVSAVLQLVAALTLAPLLVGVINKTKAVFAGRVGPPLTQAYSDLCKLLKKAAVFSKTTTWVFRAGPIVTLAAVMLALLFVPFGKLATPLAFGGDLFLVAYLLGLGRFFTVLAALDTGSSFEGMGASREAKFGALAEPGLLLGLLTLARVSAATSDFSLSAIARGITLERWQDSAPALVLVAIALVILLLAENARIPVDDPNTHLELTMIHEVMVLDHSGPDFGFILYGAALKLWLFAAVIVGLILPAFFGNLWLDLGVVVLGVFAIGVLVGIVESCMARLRLLHVSHLLLGSAALVSVALIMTFGWSA